jgi:hypothetical protein
LALLGLVALLALIGSLLFLRPVVRQAPPHPAPQMISASSVTQPPIAHPVAVPPAAPPQPASPVQAKATPTRAALEIVRPVRHGRCPRFAAEAWCLHGTITAADGELRGAYQAAVRAGVDRAMLIGIRSDWKRLRGRANRDPQALIRGYALLTQQLRAETRRVRR